MNWGAGAQVSVQLRINAGSPCPRLCVRAARRAHDERPLDRARDRCVFHRSNAPPRRARSFAPASPLRSLIAALASVVIILRSRDRQVEEDLVRLPAGRRPVHGLRLRAPQLARSPRVRAGAGRGTRAPLPPPPCAPEGNGCVHLPLTLAPTTVRPAGCVPVRQEARQAHAVDPRRRLQVRPL